MTSPVNLKQKAQEIRKLVLTSSFEAGACHLGSALSCVETMVDIHYWLLQPEDFFVFSKASGVATYYSILADKGYFPKEDIAKHLKAHPLPSKDVPGVIHSCGSLGHGLPVAVGLAYANPTKQVYVLMSDGECQEGTTYESALFARQHNLNNLQVFIDYNRIQALGFTKDIADISTALEFLKQTLPNVVVKETIKGKGVSWMENVPAWHYRNLTQEQLNDALSQI